MRFQASERTVDRTAVSESLFGVPPVEDDAELLQVLADVRQHVLQRELDDPVETLHAYQCARSFDDGIDVCFLISSRRVGRQAHEHVLGRAVEAGAHFRAQLLRDGAHVVASVTVLRKGQRFTADLQVTYPGAHREDVYLTPGIVDVVFATDVEPRRFEQVCERRPIGRLTSVTHVQRASRIRRDKFD